jgi:catechol 2,3-dioxygenase-like lactoylglutathione lyase family enzyme
MIDHLSSYAPDFDATRGFYLAVLGALGFEVQMEFALDQDENLPGRRVCAWGPPGRPIFSVVEAKHAIDPRHVAFEAADRAAVDRFHAAGIATGAADHGAPGLREIYSPDYYGAFLIDPDGNNVEAVCHTPVP